MGFCRNQALAGRGSTSHRIPTLTGRTMLFHCTRPQEYLQVFISAMGLEQVDRGKRFGLEACRI